MRREIAITGLSIFILVLLVPYLTLADTMLEWGGSDGEITGYRIYYGTTQGQYSANSETGNVTQYALSNLPLTEGETYYFVVRAYNAAGESDNSNEVSWTAPDNTPPMSPQGVSVENGGSRITWQANSEADLGGYRVYYSASSGAYGSFMAVGSATDYTVEGLNQGSTYYFVVSAVDTSGNESSYSNEVSSTISVTPPPQDTTKPGVSITLPSTTGTFETQNPAIDLSGTASDNVGVTEVTWSNSAGTSGTAEGTADWSIAGVALSPGINMISVAAKDSAGNESAAVLSVTYTPPDTTKPSISILSPSSTGTFETENPTIDLSGTASDNVGITEVTWSNSAGTGGTAAGTANWSVSGIELHEGENIINVVAMDGAGNTAEQSVRVIYNPEDTTIPPVIKRTKPTSWGYYFTRRRVMNLSGTATDNVGVEKVEWSTSTGQSGAATGTEEWAVTGIRLSGGWNDITITATDKEGNQSMDHLSVVCWSF